ncbi:MAG: hypothetical protein M3296_10420 [Actinomycetota bacterium]|nr:hypothetical protein [Actinomycetota bacterium]
MSALDRPAPPAGEEIHLPGPSLHPVLLTVGITLTLVGVTIAPVLVLAGVVLTVAVMAKWIAATRREMDELPREHAEP